MDDSEAKTRERYLANREARNNRPDFQIAEPIKVYIETSSTPNTDYYEREEEARAERIADSEGLTSAEVFGDTHFRAYCCLKEINQTISEVEDSDYKRGLLGVVDELRRHSPSAWRRFTKDEQRPQPNFYTTTNGRLPVSSSEPTPNYRELVQNLVFLYPHSPESRELRLADQEIIKLLRDSLESPRHLRIICASLGVSIINDTVELTPPKKDAEIARQEFQDPSYIRRVEVESGKTISRERARQIIQRSSAKIVETAVRNGLVDKQ